MIDSLNAGDTITCTITKVPANKAARDTIVRLMRRDPDTKRGLARAQRMRRQRMHAYIRGGRMWYSRERAAKIAQCENGNSWKMDYTHDIRPELSSIESYIEVAKG